MGIACEFWQAFCILRRFSAAAKCVERVHIISLRTNLHSLDTHTLMATYFLWLPFVRVSHNKIIATCEPYTFVGNAPRERDRDREDRTLVFFCCCCCCAPMNALRRWSYKHVRTANGGADYVCCSKLNFPTSGAVVVVVMHHRRATTEGRAPLTFRCAFKSPHTTNCDTNAEYDAPNRLHTLQGSMQQLCESVQCVSAWHPVFIGFDVMRGSCCSSSNSGCGVCKLPSIVDPRPCRQAPL